MDVKDIEKIVEMVRANELAELELEQDDFRLFVRSKSDEPVVAYSGMPQQSVVMAAPAVAPVAAPVAVVDVVDEDAGLIEIKSPIVGTFYSASSPESPAFIKIGDQVTEDSVVCIVEAMKVMNEINAEVKGTIRKIMIDNATPVEFGQVMFKVDPA